MTSNYIVFRKCKEGQHDRCFKHEKTLGSEWWCVCQCHDKGKRNG